MDIHQPIAYWVKVVDRQIDSLFANTLEEHGITRRQWQLLTVLSRGPAGVEQLDTEIAPYLPPLDAAAESAGVGDITAGADTTAGGPAATSSSRDSLAELVESEWLTTEGDRYELTERGRAIVDRLTDVIADERTRATVGLSAEQYDTAITVLETMARNLGTS